MGAGKFKGVALCARTHLYLLMSVPFGRGSGVIGLRHAPPPEAKHIPWVLPLFCTHPLPHDVQTSEKLPAAAVRVRDGRGDNNGDEVGDVLNARLVVSATEKGMFGVAAEMVVLTRTDPASGKKSSLTKMLTVSVAESPLLLLPRPSLGVGMEQCHTCVMAVPESVDAPARTQDDGDAT